MSDDDIGSKWEGFEALAQKLQVYYAHVETIKGEWPEEVTKWQREDMHRRFPETTTSVSDNIVTAETDVWPRSRLEVGPAAQRPKRLKTVVKQGRATLVRRGPRQVMPGGVGKGLVASHRPILRLALLQKLKERMMALAREAIKWP
jgi:broad specificity phosphatase PhoE